MGWLSLLPDELNQLGKHITAGTGFISNFILWNEAGYFDVAAESKPLLHLWSLGIEEQFYIIWPLLLWLAYKRHFNLLTITIVVSTISFALNIRSVTPNPVATFYAPWTRFWELLCGSLLAYIVLYQKQLYAHIEPLLTHWVCRIFYQKGILNPQILPNIISFIGIGLLILGFIKIHKGLAFPGKYAVIPVAGTVLLILAGSQAWINRKILSHKIAIWFGLISFPLYLWHWPLLTFARIIDNNELSSRHRNIALVASIILAWLTVKFIERPFRFSQIHKKGKVTLLVTGMLVLGIAGIVINKTNLSSSHSYDKLILPRKGFEHALGPSLAWYRGKDDWLFLGNAYDNTVAKLKLASLPEEVDITQTINTFSNIAQTAAQYKTQVVLLIGPNKSSIYPEYLPNKLVPSPKRYVEYFLTPLRNISNLTVYDPTSILLNKKKTEGILYWRTDTHWNQKGAFIAFQGLMNQLGIPSPTISFQINATHQGDLISIANLKGFPLYSGDNWEYTWQSSIPSWREEKDPEQKETSFGVATTAINNEALSTKTVWVIGDSFSNSLRPFINATFTKTIYKGHWGDKLSTLARELEQASTKPDLIIIERVERSF